MADRYTEHYFTHKKVQLIFITIVTTQCDLHEILVNYLYRNGYNLLLVCFIFVIVIVVVIITLISNVIDS